MCILRLNVNSAGKRIMISESFLLFMVIGTAIVVLVAMVALVVKLYRNQRDSDSR